MKKMTGIILMSLGIILLVSGFVIYRSSKNKPIDISTSQVKSSIDVNKQKGDDFETFIAENFNNEYFSIADWTGDKKANGQFVESNMNPDLIMKNKFNNKEFLFAVECKYRQEFINGIIEISYPEQLKRYKKFEQEKNMPVFMAIGIGGKAKSPESLFIIPIRKLNKTTLNREELSPYYKNPASKFFYHAFSKKLE